MKKGRRFMGKMDNLYLKFRNELEEVLRLKGYHPRLDMVESLSGSFPLLNLHVQICEKLHMYILLTSNFPKSPPVALIQFKQEMDAISFPWDPDETWRVNIMKGMDGILAEEGPLIKGYGTDNGLVLTEDANKARLAKWHTVYTPKRPDMTISEIQEGIFSRTLGVLSKDILFKRVLIIGVGSVGSYIAEQMVRSGVGSLIMIDPDVVEYSNLSRTNYCLADVGKPKVEALAGLLLNINPSIKQKFYAKDIQDFSAVELNEMFGQSDVVVAATDDPRAQRTINRFAYGNGKPAIFVGLYEGADGGEVILSVPDTTPCYQCATSIRHQVEQTAGEVGVKTDYGTGKMEGVIALPADIHHVSSAAVKVILSFLIPDDSMAKLKDFVRPPLEKEFSYLTFSMKDQYWFYPHIFQDVPGQYAYQSVWLSPTRNEDCPVCGTMDNRTPPSFDPVRTPTLAGFRRVLD
jgi:hypothetical protein